jgi:hypothetical protein
MSRITFQFLVGISAWGIVGIAYAAFQWSHPEPETLVASCYINNIEIDCEDVLR